MYTIICLYILVHCGVTIQCVLCSCVDNSISCSCTQKYLYVDVLRCVVCVCVYVCVFVCTVHGREPLPTLDAHEVQQVRCELAQIRDRINVIVDSLDVKAARESGSRGSSGSKQRNSGSTPQPDTPVTKSEGLATPTLTPPCTLFHQHFTSIWKDVYMYIIFTTVV